MALEKVVEIANHVNESKRVSENMETILTIQKQLSKKYNNLLAPHRYPNYLWCSEDVWGNIK